MKGQHFLQFVKFLTVGVVNAFMALFVIYAAKWILDLDDIAANALGYAVGLSISFLLNGRWTFTHTGPKLPALGKFLLVALVAYGMNLVTVLLAINYIGLNEYVAQALGIPPYTLTSFFASKYLVFRSHDQLS